jgi:hypothetical protein
LKEADAFIDKLVPEIYGLTCEEEIRVIKGKAV